MARVNVYLPDDLAEEARAAGVNVSSITQGALREALAGRRSSEWLRGVRRHRGAGVSHERVLAALDAVRDEAGDDWPGDAAS